MTTTIAICASAWLTLPPPRAATAGDVAERVGLGPQADKQAAALTIAGRKRLELAKALATDPKAALAEAGLPAPEIPDFDPTDTAGFSAALAEADDDHWLLWLAPAGFAVGLIASAITNWGRA